MNKLARLARRVADYRGQSAGGRLPGAAVNGPAWAGRALRLPVAPTADHAAELAQSAVDAEQNISGIELDYTPASLNRVDEVLSKFREPGSDAVAESIFVFGCYVGEVLVRNAGYEWVDSSPEVARWGGQLTVYRDSDKAHASPIWKAFKRVNNGEVDSVAYYYQVCAVLGDGARPTFKESFAAPPDTTNRPK